ncbi:Na+-dependent transporter, SNF family [Balnearium lithotrophicum]|uniref:Na+-dependent transporter, SNF family n=1 Tax=Balnearium lithotrophicum TaxID=223788 RepID=A0A521AAU1_9BACT|nr:sodium-dependent transporter [Balnearium lithotrophicum]SMO31933.1 Na+-dependent transporter, SNF family [Balnearium lithotrophicum]
MESREHWSSRIGLILAMAGNAVGLGNFLRFPTQAAQNGGGAFMIPYMIAMLLIAIPLMWTEWAIGRYGGAKGHGTTPAIFRLLWKNPISKYIGVLGLFVPFVVLCYYIYIESWTLGYSFYALLGLLPHPDPSLTQSEFLKPFENLLREYTKPSVTAYIFFLITVAFNGFILYRGISGGIEKFAKIAMPTLFILALFLMVRVILIETPHGTAVQGLDFLWHPNLSELSNPKVWLAAAGQVFFTLSLGFGAIITYASYIKKDDDIVASGLSAASLNELAEVILGGSIAIPAAVAFFGVINATSVASSGAFNLAFVTLPALFSQLTGGDILGFFWFFLLFFAGATSSVAITMPIVAFLEDEFGLSRKIAVTVTVIFTFLVAQIPIFMPKALDEMDFWAGTFFVVLFALLEVVVFFWLFGGERAWEEINRGALFKVPKLFYYILKYVTPLSLFAILSAWTLSQLPQKLVTGDFQVWAARFVMIFILALQAFMVYLADRRRRNEG